MERISNASIFISACGELNVKTRFTEKDIEHLKPEDWLDMVKTLHAFANKVENNDPRDETKKAFKGNLDGLKLSIDQLSKEWKNLNLEQ